MTNLFVNAGIKTEAAVYLLEHAPQYPEITDSHQSDFLCTWKDEILVIEGPLLIALKLKDGRICKSLLQEYKFTDNHIFGFLCLEINGAKRFRWTKKEVEAYLDEHAS